MIGLWLLLGFFYQIAWRQELTLWGGHAYLLELIILILAFERRWRAGLLWALAFLAGSLYLPLSILPLILLALIGFVLARFASHYVDTENRLAQQMVIVFAISLFLAGLYLGEARAFSPAFFGSLILTLPFTFLRFLFIPTRKRRLL